MSSLNVVHLIGNLGQDPELRNTESGLAVTNLSIATNEVYKDAEGERQQRTEWHRIVVFGKQAESCAKFLSKGRRVQVEGRLRTRRWTDSNGLAREATEIVASKVQFLDRQKAA
jgi:single-strand DNA-binding protein